MPPVETSIDFDTINKVQKQVEALEQLEGLLLRRMELGRSILELNQSWLNLLPAPPIDFDSASPRFIQRHRRHG